MSNNVSYPKKSEIVSGAFDRLAISGITSKPTAEDSQVGLDLLEDTMQAMEVDGYNYEDTPQGNSVTGLERSYNRALKDILSFSIAGFYGKQITAQIQMANSAGVSFIEGKRAVERSRRTPYPTRQPRGSGNRRFNPWQNFYPQSFMPTETKNTAHLTWGGTVSHSLDLQHWLNGAVITGYEIVYTDNALTVNSSSSTDTTIDMVVSCANQSNTYQVIEVKVTADNGNVATFCILFKTSEC